jgi:DNA ligase-1
MDIRSFFGGKGAPKSNENEPTAIPKASSSKTSSEKDNAPNGVKKAVSEEKENTLESQSGGPNTANKSTEKEGSSKAESGSSTASASSSADPPSSGSSSSTVTTEDVTDIPPAVKKIITWKAGDKIPYSAVVNTFDAVSKVSGRLEKEGLFARLFQAVLLTSPSELETVVYLVSNEVAPSYEGLELGIGDSLLIKAVCEATGRNRAAVVEDYNREGDLGVVALSSRAKQNTLSFAAKPKVLTVKDVHEKFLQITQTKGDKAQQRKVDVIKAMMIKCQGNEAMYIVRALQGKLRIGTAAQTVLVSLGTAFSVCTLPSIRKMMEEDEAPVTEGKEDRKRSGASSSGNAKDEKTMDVDGENGKVAEKEDDETWEQKLGGISIKQPPESRELQKALAGKSKNGGSKLDGGSMSKERRIECGVIAIKRAFSECPSLTLLTKALLSAPMYKLFQSCKLVPGLPVAPMLAKPQKKITEVLQRLSGMAFTMEYKYDGERAQVHLLSDGSVKVFSRNSLDDSNKYPDLISNIHEARTEAVTTCIVDAEVVAWDRERNVLLPFQILSTRKRKVEEGESDNQKVKVVLQAFDLLFLNEKSLLQEPLRVRRKLLHTAFREVTGLFYFATGQDLVEDGDTSGIESFMAEACTAQCEGLMVKTLDDNATYDPSKRSLNWLKLKKDYIEGMGVADSVDLVVIGAYHGKGKRTNVYGAYLMACYDPENDEYQSVCKVGTGFKDEDLVKLTESMKPHIVQSQRKPVNFNTAEQDADEWFSPTVVWELQAADLSLSSKHKGAVGIINPDRGIGLRFPRFLRERPDKKAEGATNSEQIADMYKSQDLNGVNGGAEDNGDDDDDDDGI